MKQEQNRVADIINTIRTHGTELPWIELKQNYADPQDIGEYISALSNTAALYNQSHGFVIWGVNDESHEVVGTSFNPQRARKGNQSLELWIGTQLRPHVMFFFHNTTINDKQLVLLEVMAANSTPVRFRGTEYIRIGANKKKLRDFPDTERQLWATFSRTAFEEGVAVSNVSVGELLQLLDYESYYSMLSEELPSSDTSVVERMQSEKMITRNATGGYDILNLAAILFARRLSDFSSLERKTVRIIRYYGDDRASSTSKEYIGEKGYANGFEMIVDCICNAVPAYEVVNSALRKLVTVYPEAAIRELVANLLMHQDFFLSGTGPMVEIFNSRIEVTNPGAPLIEKDRFVDHPPVSRNEKLARLMRRLGICEERGMGYDRVVLQTEIHQLPAPNIDIYDNFTRVTLYTHRPFAKMSKVDKQRACYLHACLKRVNNDYMTNSSLRERFAIDAKNSSMISRLLNETHDAGLIKLSEDSPSGKHRKFLPYWA
jgi:predicted HTH transcriptional regulator